MWRFSWELEFGIGLLVLSLLLYTIHYTWHPYSHGKRPKSVRNKNMYQFLLIMELSDIALNPNHD